MAEHAVPGAADGIRTENTRAFRDIAMSMANFERSTTAELVAAYRDAAEKHGAATESADHKNANKTADVFAGVYSELRRRGIESQRLLVALLTSPSPGVRLWAASHALEFAPLEGEPVLVELSAGRNLIGLSAEMTLREWRNNRLRFP